MALMNDSAVARAVNVLAADKSSHITRKTLSVNGGMGM